MQTVDFPLTARWKPEIVDGFQGIHMDIKRKAYEDLRKWKDSSNHAKALMIKGARRVGKSYLAEHFAKEAYDSHIVIDFASPRKGTMNIFSDYASRETIDDFFNQLSVLYSVPLYPKKSLLIFDEIQKYPPAREFIKYIVADGRYDCIETGSLISIKKNVRDIVIPSEEEELLLYPLDFEEFLNAQGDYVTVPYLRKAYEEKRPLGRLLKAVNEKLRNYMVVGGMPQAVDRYIETGNYDQVEKVKRGIIKLYREDIAKYADNYVAEATAIFDSIPAILSHHDKKIRYSSVTAGGRPNGRFRDAVLWIADSMVGNICYGVDEPGIFGNFLLQQDKVKCYMGDTGLLLTLAAGKNYLTSDLYKSFVLGKLSVNKGMMTENLAAQMLTASGHSLRFFETRKETEGKIKKYEVDFIIQKQGKFIPIEVKSGNSRNHPSIDFFSTHIKQKSGKGILLTKGDFRETEEYLFLPLPMAMFL